MPRSLPQPRAIFIGRTNGILREIVKPLADAGFHVTVFAPLIDEVWRIRGIEEIHEIPDLKVDELVKFIIKDLRILELRGWFFWSSNELARGILESDIPESTKSKLLNGIRLEEASIIGSRVNQVRLFQRLNLPIPTSFVITSTEDAQRLPNNLPMISKSDVGGRGEGVLDFHSDGINFSNKDIDYPFIVQEKIHGPTFHVEVFFEEGELIYWAFSREIGKGVGYGYCPIREYSSPTNLDFLESITKVGRHLQISGPVGTAFIHDGSKGIDKLIEFDVNCGVWHHSFAFLNFPLGRRLSSVMEGRNFEPSNATVHLPRPLRFYDRHELFQLARSGRVFSKNPAVLLGLGNRRIGSPMPSSFSLTVIIRRKIHKWLIRLANVQLRQRIE